MPAVTYNFLPEGGTLASGVREPSAMVKGGVATYINLDPDVSPDVAYEAAALPAASSPAWTAAPSGGTPTESVSGGELTVSCDSGEALYYVLGRSGLVSTSPAYLRLRMKVTASGTSLVQSVFLRIADSDKQYECLGYTDRYASSVLTSAVYGIGAGLDATTFHVVELCKIKNTKLSLYIDGRWVCDTPRAFFGSSASDQFLFGIFLPNATTTAVFSSVHLKDATLWPSTSPTADFVFDSGSPGTVWDMSTIAMVENLFGEAGNLKYKYGAGETTSPTLSGSFQTAAQLTSESNPTGRYLRINVQLNGDGSQDAGWGGMSIAATTVSRAARLVNGGLVQ